MKFARFVLPALAIAGLAGCSFQNKYERQAQAITQAVIDNDMRPVQNDIAPSVHVTRVQIAALSDQLAGEGKLISVKEDPKACPPAAHCFDVKFEKHTWYETMVINEQGKVAGWHIVRMAPSGG